MAPAKNGASEQHAPATNPTTLTDRLPQEVVNCLRNARFLHLATCTDNIPHVSLMNYTYLPTHPFSSSANSSSSTSSRSNILSGPTIIMTSNPSSKKTQNLLGNPHVSLLVHDWVSSRPPPTTNLGGSGSGGERDRSPTAATRSSLAAMLMQMNSTAVSSNSITINGRASVLAVGSEEERWCKEQHLANNTFDDHAGAGSRSASLSGVSGGNGGGGGVVLGGGAVTTGGVAEALGPGALGDSGKGAYIEVEDVRVVVVRIQDGRISDWKGNVKDWSVADTPTPTETARPAAVIQEEESMVNGT